MKTLFFAVVCHFSLYASDISGFWKNVDQKTGKPGALIAIYEYKDKHYGRIIGSYDKDGILQDTIEHAESRASKIKGNPFYSGIDFIWNLDKKGSRYKGKIMDPRKARTYDVELWMEKENLIVRGQLLCFGRNTLWQPAQESDLASFIHKPDLTHFIPVIPEAN